MRGISSPIEQRNTGKGNPNAIIHFDRPLNQRQKSLLEHLPAYDSRMITERRNVNLRDLAAMTAVTGDEFALFTRKGQRMIVRSNAFMTNVDVDSAEVLAAEGWRWSGHTHPGTDVNAIMPSYGDYEVLKAFRQRFSVILDARGRYGIFGDDQE